MEQYFYKVEDEGDRLWSTETACWIPAGDVPPGIEVTPLNAGGRACLRETLKFYGFPLGELATRVERIADVQKKYRPGLAELDAAYLSAQIDGDEETMAEIADEKRELRAAMADEITTIQQEAE